MNKSERLIVIFAVKWFEIVVNFFILVCIRFQGQLCSEKL